MSKTKTFRWTIYNFNRIRRDVRRESPADLYWWLVFNVEEDEGKMKRETTMKMIPCSERLPEKEGEYLVLVACHNGIKNHIWQLGWTGKMWLSGCQVIAWCELPEMPNDEFEVKYGFADRLFSQWQDDSHQECSLFVNNEKIMEFGLCSHKMFLDQSHVRKLLPLLKRFVDTGSIAP